MPFAERDIMKIRRRLEQDGWVVLRESGPHTIFGHAKKSGRVVVPKGRGDLASGTALNIAKAAGWLEK